ncbi:hypothetical protein KMW28_24515 [Flammeovirga yaeyamensis]|uniref:Prevent-host-death family protein n=1 Tax=Flammeovirga yaeyamensis TaxID=367791 RepID=A0AAX1N919_9BACT|nr:hypothetical protein [Flammeovirga yaeyamensis]MBB3699550.1 hypothetical protein [Flammeovirga yaeyamensis]NMF35195.1 hypothetical protein [Flammeovirga yaeyamensis]QWG04059.1 hypothetical protein KMW28_24515 [Flammeovirga yaeyamensis]
MTTQFITDNQGNKLAVILPINEYNKILEELEELEEIKLYDEAKRKDTGERIPMEDAFNMIEEKRNKK